MNSACNAKLRANASVFCGNNPENGRENDCPSDVQLAPAYRRDLFLRHKNQRRQASGTEDEGSVSLACCGRLELDLSGEDKSRSGSALTTFYSLAGEVVTIPNDFKKWLVRLPPCTAPAVPIVTSLGRQSRGNARRDWLTHRSGHRAAFVRSRSSLIGVE